MQTGTETVTETPAVPSTLPNSPVGSTPVSNNTSSISLGNGETGLEQVTTTTKGDPYGPRRWHSHLVKLSGRNRALNEFSVERIGEPVEENLVMLHGYGAGLGFYYKNFEALSRVPGWKIWALDMLGMGRSSRPNFRIQSKDPKKKIEEAENWFIDALEEWRIQKKLEKFTLLGHSLGGYLSVAYALKYPGRLNKLILVSPVGIPEDPWAVSSDAPHPESSTMANEFTQDQGETTEYANLSRTHSNSKNIPAQAMNADNLATEARGKPSTQANNNDEPSNPPRRLPKWFSYLWDANISPFSIVRLTGPLGLLFVSSWTSRRFSQMPPPESQALHDYAYSLFRQKGSGEYALSYLLAPGAFARSPLINRIERVGRLPLSQSSQTSNSPTPADQMASPENIAKETGIPVILMYGDHDWMDVKGGFAAEKKLNAMRETVLKTATEAEKKAENGKAKVIIVKKAGHHVYLDGWEEFNEIMEQELTETRDYERRLKAKF
jgi:cardiolipin-specific phospholipase